MVCYQLKRANQSWLVTINWTEQPISYLRTIKKIIFSNYEHKMLSLNEIQPFEATVYEGS